MRSLTCEQDGFRRSRASASESCLERLRISMDGAYFLFCGAPQNRKGLFHTAEAGERDRRSEVAAFLQVPEQFKAVHARHDQIRHDDVRVEGSEPFQRFLPVARDLRLKVALGKHGSQGVTLPLVIIDDEDPARNRGQSGHCLPL